MTIIFRIYIELVSAWSITKKYYNLYLSIENISHHSLIRNVYLMKNAYSENIV